jgi:hypothetical protein
MYLLSAHVSTLEFAGNGPRWRFRVKQAAAKFFASYEQIWPLSSFQDGVSGVHKITRYEDDVSKLSGLL